MALPYQLAISFNDAGPDALVVTDGEHHLCLGTVADEAIYVITPDTLLADAPDCLPLPRELVEDDKKVHLDGDVIGSGFGCLAGAAYTALVQSKLVADADFDDTGETIVFSIALAEAPVQAASVSAAPLPPQAPPAPSASGTLPQVTPPNDIPAVHKKIAAGQLATPAAPYAVTWALMVGDHPDGSGDRTFYLTPLAGSEPGVPAIMIGEDDPKTGLGVLAPQQFLADAGIFLTALKSLDDILMADGSPADPKAVETLLQDSWAVGLGQVQPTVAYDPTLSQTLGAFVYHTVATNPDPLQLGTPAGAGSASTAAAPASAPTMPLPQSTPQENLQGVKQALASQAIGTAQAPLNVDWVLMKTPHPNGNGLEAIVIAPANATMPGLPAFMIGEINAAQSDSLLDGTFVPLGPGLPLTPLRLPPGTELFDGNEIEEQELDWFLQIGLGRMVDPRFANLDYDAAASTKTGAATFHSSIGGTIPGSGAGHSSGGAPAGGGSTLPEDADLPDVDVAVADLAEMAAADPDLFDKLSAIPGLEDELRKRKEPRQPPEAPKPFFGVWS